MRKKILFLITFLFLLTIVGCGKYDENDVLKDLEKKVNNASVYTLKGILQITNNEDTYQYDVEANYKKDNNYRVSLINQANDHEQIILKNKDGVYIITPSLNKSFKFQSDWPNNNSQVYLLQSLLNDIKKDENRKFEQIGDKYVLTTKVNYPNNNEFINQKITMNKNLNIESVEVLDSNGIAKMIMKFDSIDFKSNFSDDYFELNSIIEEIDSKEQSADKNIDNKNSDDKTSEKGNNSDSSEDNEETGTTSGSTTEYSSAIDDIIYPLYIPTGTSLVEQEKISKTDGERVILTFDGEKPFLLVEETSSITDEFSVIPTFGEPYLLIDTIGALTDNSISWSSNGMDYYIVSDVMSQTELIEIASSITAIPTLK